MAQVLTLQMMELVIYDLKMAIRLKLKSKEKPNSILGYLFSVR
jgi:hypothetical protein